ncbi:MAG: hypothetical protein J6K97_01225 [Clostridia bacterium]|nr:hypothetical protein [Clostridia bacterium]
MTGIWENEEVKKLFLAVEKCKQQNRPIREAFGFHAEKFARKPNSVRNYYYHEIDALKKDVKRRNMLGIDLSKHEKTNIVYFSKAEEGSLMQEIEKMTKNGVSVRKACLSLASGDVSLMLRYQNKYRNFIAKQNLEKKEKVSGGEKIIAFKKPAKSLSDSEVQSLFMGLVRLVKKNASLEGEEKYKQKLQKANDQLRKALADLHNQSMEIDRLKEKYQLLKSQNNALAENVLRLRCDKAESLRRKFDSARKREKELTNGQK